MATSARNGPVGVRQFEEAIHAGIRRAYQDYPVLSELDVKEAPEYYLTVKIADELKKLKLFVDLECSVKTTLKLAGAVQPGPIPTKLRGNGRFDFVAHSLGNKPRFLGEVKHPVGVISRLDKDLERICGVLNHGRSNSFQSGVIAFYAFKKKRAGSVEALQKLIDELQKRCTIASSESSCNVRMSWKSLAKHDDYASASVCMLIS